MIDTHCHLIDEAFTADVEACIVRAQEAGVTKMMLACCDEQELAPIVSLAQRHPGQVFASVGIHPENMASDVDQQLASLRQRWLILPQGIIKAIGEIGIDLHWDKTRLDDQLHVLSTQLDWAMEADLPVLLHIRDAMPEFLEFLRLYILNNNKRTDGEGKPRRLRGILHCYSGTTEQAQEAMELADLLIGVGGTVTYKKSLVPEIVKALGLEKIVLETDAPYLAPLPHRGKRNEPAYTADTARFIATLLGTTVEEVNSVTTRNAELLLKI